MAQDTKYRASLASPPSRAAAMQHAEALALVRPIPAGLLAQLRSQLAISSISGVVTELVANAVDAGASEVAVRLECTPACLRLSVTDNGAGVPAASLPLLGTRSATSKLHSLAQLEAGVPTLGFRGEALAAIGETAVVEVVSRARGSFETHAVLLRGGTQLKSGLALEQRSRQGTVVTVSDLFYNQPVKRRALLGSGLGREVERCRDAVVRLALIRPHVTFTVFDCNKHAFLLKMLKGRPLEQSIAQFLGQPSAEHLAVVAPAAGAACHISGHVLVPPLGAPNTSRQLVYVDGHCVRAAPVYKLVDGLFQQAYKANARLVFVPGGEELQSQQKAANRHAAFVLQLRCVGADCQLSFDLEKMAVQFSDWQPVLDSVRHAVLLAWRPVLTVALLKQLEQLEGASLQAKDSAREQQQHGVEDLRAFPFQQWLAQEQAQGSLEALLQQRAEAVSCQQAAAAAEAAERSRGSGQQRASGGLHKPLLAGTKHGLFLTSRPMRFGQAEASELTSMEPPEQRPEQQQAQQQEDVPQRKRVRIADSPQVFLVSPMHAGHKHQYEPQPQLLEQDQQDQHQEWEHTDAWCIGSKEGMEPVIPGWQPEGYDLWPYHQQQPQVQDLPAWVKSLRNQLAQQPEVEDWHSKRALAASSSFDADLEQQLMPQCWSPGQQHEATQQQGLSSEEQEMLAKAAGQPLVLMHSPRPQSAPPHAKTRRRTVHTNPLHSLRAAQDTEGPERRQGVRGVDTISGLGWRQQKAAVEEHGARDTSAGQSKETGSRPEKQVCRGLWQKPSLPPTGLPAIAAALQAGPPAAARNLVAVPASLDAGYGSESEAPVVKREVPGPGSKAAMFATLEQQSSSMRSLQPAPAGLEALVSSWCNPVMLSATAAGEGVLSLDDLAASCFAQLKPAALSREQLQGAKALQQVDSKFIPVTCGSLLALVDQHAADERVQLERLREELLAEGGRPDQHVTSMQLRHAQPLQLSDAESQLLEAYGDRVARWGWRWLSENGRGSSGRHRQYTLTHAPMLFGSAVLSSADLKLYLHHLHDTCGAAGLPAGVVRVLNSKACRGAIMFGQRLLPVQCQALLENLKHTQLCFSCAHGRPTTVPLVDLARLRRVVQLKWQHGQAAKKQAGPALSLASLRAKLQCDISAA